MFDAEYQKLRQDAEVAIKRGRVARITFFLVVAVAAVAIAIALLAGGAFLIIREYFGPIFVLAVLVVYMISHLPQMLRDVQGTPLQEYFEPFESRFEWREKAPEKVDPEKVVGPQEIKLRIEEYQQLLRAQRELDAMEKAKNAVREEELPNTR